MKKAFTMLELVFVIVVVGILSYFVSTGFQRNPLREAADQVVSHIRYTQHLAMMDDKFSATDSNWFLGRWQIRFSTANGYQSYFIMADTILSSYDANPNAPANFSYSEVAKDPLNSNKYLIGTTYSSFDTGSNEHINSKLNFTSSYGINDISMSGGSTGSTASRIVFDELGRPYRGDTKLSNAGHISSSVDKVNISTVHIKLCLASCTLPNNTANNKGEIVIVIEPETGYTHIQ